MARRLLTCLLYTSNVLEKDLNLQVAEKLAKELKKRGASVLLTRTDDTKIPLEERAAMANETEADLFVSIHCNYCEDDSSVQAVSYTHLNPLRSGPPESVPELGNLPLLPRKSGEGAPAEMPRIHSPHLQCPASCRLPVRRPFGVLPVVRNISGQKDPEADRP